MLPALNDGEYPISAGIAYLFLSGYLWRSIFVALHLPASVGVMLSGFLFSYFSQDSILAARDEIQELAFFIVLLIAGLEIRLDELRPYIFALAWLPVFLEIVGIGVFAHLWMGYPPQEGIVLGTVCASLGDGLVIPKLKEFMHSHPKHPLPKLVFMWAPLEASFVLTAFGIVTGSASPKAQTDASMTTIVAANILRIVLTVVCGAVLGGTAGYLIPKRTDLKLFGTRLFSGQDLEAFLMLLSVSLFALALGKASHGHFFVPMGFCSGSMFQPELLVIITGMIFANVVDKPLLREIEKLLGHLWVFGQIILFSMLGSKTSTSTLPALGNVLPIMAAGFSVRFVGVTTGVLCTMKARGCHTWDTVWSDTAFCFLCTLPRATIQGALGAVPLTMHFFATHDYTNKVEAREFIFTSARLYIICTSIVGMVLLTTFGPMLMDATADAHERHAQRCLLMEEATEGETAHDTTLPMAVKVEHGEESCADSNNADNSASPEASPTLCASEEELERDILETIAAKYGFTYDALLGILENKSASPEDGVGDRRLSTRSAFSSAASAVQSANASVPNGLTDMSSLRTQYAPMPMTETGSGDSDVRPSSSQKGRRRTPLSLTAVMLKHQVAKMARRAPTLRRQRTTARSRSTTGAEFLMFDMNIDGPGVRRSSRSSHHDLEEGVGADGRWSGDDSRWMMWKRSVSE